MWLLYKINDMKNNYLLLFLFLFILGLVFKKLDWPNGGLLFILSTVLLIIIYTKRLFKPKGNPADLKRILIEISIYLIFTLIGILFRQQFWPFPFWYVLFKYVWPVFSLIVIIHSIKVISKTQFQALTKEYKNKLLKDFLIPLVIVFLLSIPTFFTPTKDFIKIFKSYSYEEFMDKRISPKE